VNSVIESIEFSESLASAAAWRCTEAQFELYQYIYAHIHLYGHAPSIRQMMRAMDLKSPAPVQARLGHLRKHGFVTWEQGRARSVRVLVPLHEGFQE